MEPLASLAIYDPYAELGIDRNASQEEIKKAYFLAVRAHPPEQEPEAFQRVRAAYELLRTPELRANTDLFLIQLPPAAARRRTVGFDLSFQIEDAYRLARTLGDLGRTSFRDDYRKIEA